MRPLEAPPELVAELERLRQRVRELEQEQHDAGRDKSLPHSSSDHYRLLYENTPSMSFALATDGTVLSVNEFGAEQLGFHAVHLIGQSVLLVFDPTDHESVRNQLQLCAENPYKVFQWEIQKVHKTGRRLWVKETARSVRNNQGSLIILVMCEDITARKQAIEALRESENRLRALHDQAPLGIAIIDSLSGRFEQVNQKYCEIAGYSKEDMLAQTFQNITHPEDLQEDLDNMAELLSGRIDSFRMEKRYFRKDGSIVWVNLTCVPLWLGAADRRLHIAMVEDITERKRTEEALQASETRFREIAETIEEVVWSADPAIGKMLYISPAYERVWGRSCASLYENPKSFLDAIHPDDQAPILADLAVQKDGLPFAHEYRVVRPDGVIRWVWDRGFPIRDHETGHLTHYVGVALDITERKQAEQALKDNQARLQEAERIAKTGHWYMDIATNTLTWSEGKYRIFGVTPNEFTPSLESILARVHPDDVEVTKNILARLTHQRQPVKWEFRIFRPDGALRTIYCTGEARADASGDLTALIGTALDITELKQAESALRESEERFAKAFRSSPHPIIVTEVETGRCIEANDASLQLFGFQRQEVIGQSTLTLGLWPNAGERKTFVDRLLAEGSLRNLDMTFYARDRTARRFLVSCELIELHGKHCMVTVGTDITEQKRAEEALRRSELEVRQAFDERERLSQDLHDNLLQSLYAVGMGLEVTKQKLQRISQTNAKRLDKSVGQLNAVIREVRNFIPRMQSPVVGAGTVTDALRSLAKSFELTGAGPIKLSLDDQATWPLTSEHMANLIAIAKEALSNSVRHTKATERTLTLHREKDVIRLTIMDNGCGFAANRRRAQGLGLKNMRARARKLHARISISSSPRRGTVVSLTMPVR